MINMRASYDAELYQWQTMWATIRYVVGVEAIKPHANTVVLLHSAQL